MAAVVRQAVKMAERMILLGIDVYEKEGTHLFYPKKWKNVTLL
jgi:hypothetical protein